MDPGSNEDPNGNNISPPPRGAVAMQPPMVEEASALVESDEIQEVIVETPDEDLVANNTLIPELLTMKNSSGGEKRKGHFLPLYLAVEEEKSKNEQDLSEHERQLLLEYKTREAVEDMKENKQRKQQPSSQAPGDGFYEKVAPRHGDLGFHQFLSVIQKNPGHVLRYFQLTFGFSGFYRVITF